MDLSSKTEHSDCYPTILLAGSTGSIGKVLLKKLIDKNFDIICPVRKSGYYQQDETDSVRHIQLDLGNKSAVELIKQKISSIDVIISCLGSRLGTLEESKEVEFFANSQLLKVGKLFKVKQFILLSAVCVQKPKLQIHKYKIMFETELKKENINYTIIRPTAFFKSLSGQIQRVKAGKSFIVFDQGTNNRFKPISEQNLSSFICKKILNPKSYKKVFIIGGPGPSISPREQGILIFKAAGKSPKFLSIPSALFKVMFYGILPFSLFSKRLRDYCEFLKIALYYATESMLIWDKEKLKYSDVKTPEYGHDTLEEFYKIALKTSLKDIDRSDKRLF